MVITAKTMTIGSNTQAGGTEMVITAKTMTIGSNAPQAHLTIATDIGNMHSRGVWGTDEAQRRMIESYVLEIDPDRTGGLTNVYHVRSSSNELNPWIAKAFLTGGAASEVDAETGDRVLDSDTGKAKLLLPLLCDLIWEVLPSNGAIVHLFSTVHDAHSLESEMKSLNDGLYSVSKDGEVKSFTVKIERVYNEGQGVLKHQQPASKAVFLLDVGSDTIIGSAFNGYELRTTPVSLEGKGVRSLITALMTAAEVKDSIKAATGAHRGASFEEVIAALENPVVAKKKTVFVIPSLKADITSAIEVEAGRWLKDGLKAINRAMKGDIASAKVKMATGGGVMLPQVKQALEAEGFVICSDPLWANVCGIFAFGQKAQAGR